MPIKAGFDYDKTIEVARKLADKVREFAEGDLDVRVDEVMSGGRKYAQLIINGEPLTLAGAVHGRFGEAPVFRYGETESAYYGVPGAVATTKREGQSIAAGEFYDPLTAVARTISTGVRSGMSPSQSLVTGAGGMPAFVTGVSPNEPFARIVQAASGVTIAKPYGGAAPQDVVGLFMRSPEAFEGAKGVVSQETLARLAYRHDSGDAITLAPFYGPRGSNIAKAAKAATIGVRPIADRYWLNREGEISAINAEAVPGKLKMPWETEARNLQFVDGRADTFSLLYTNVPYTVGGQAFVSAGTLQHSSSAGKEIYGFARQNRFTLGNIETVNDLIEALKTSDFTENLPKSAWKLRQPGGALDIGEFGGHKISIGNKNAAYFLKSASLNVPKYYSAASGRFVDASEALGPEGELRPGYAETDFMSLVERHLGEGAVTDLARKGLFYGYTSGATPALELESVYEVAPAVKSGGPKAGTTVVGNDLGVSYGDASLDVGVVTADMKKAQLGFWESINAHLTEMERYKSPLSRQKAQMTRDLIRKSAIEAGYDISQYVGEGGLYDFSGKYGDEAMAAIADKAFEYIHKTVTSSENPVETSLKILRATSETYLPSGGTLSGIPDLDEESKRIYEESAKLAGVDLGDPSEFTGGWLFGKVPRNFTGEYMGKATLNLPFIYGFLAHGDAGKYLLSNIGIDFDALAAGRSLAKGVMEAETPGAAGWRAITSGALLSHANLSGLQVETEHVASIDERTASGLVASIGTGKSAEEGLQAADEFLSAQGIDAPLIAYNGIILPRPKHILAAAHFDEEGAGVGFMPREYIEALTSAAAGAESAQDIANSFYSGAMAHVSGKRVGKLLGVETPRGFGGRYDVSPYLKPFEMYAPKRLVSRVLRNYGWNKEEVRRVLAAGKRSGGIDAAVVREPNPEAKLLMMKMLTRDQMIQRVMERSNVSRQEASQIVNAMGLNFNVGLGVPLLFQGDADKDPITVFPMVPVKGKGGIAEQYQKIHEAADEMRVGDAMQEIGIASPHGYHALLLNELAKSAEDWKEGMLKFEAPISYGSKGAYTLDAAIEANTKTAASKRGMGTTYNARRTLMFAMSEIGVDEETASKIFRGTTPMYQYQLDLMAQGKMFIEALAKPQGFEIRPRVQKEFGQKEYMLSVKGNRAGARAGIDTEEIRMMLSANDPDAAFKKSMRKIYTQLSGGIVDDLLSTGEGDEAPPSITPHAAAGLLLGGTSQQGKIDEYAKKMEEILSGDKGAKQKRAALTSLVADMTVSVGDEAYKSVAVGTVMTGALENILDPASQRTEYGAKRAEAFMNVLENFSGEEGREYFERWASAASVSLISKGKYSHNLALLVGRARTLGHTGVLGEYTAEMYGIKGVRPSGEGDAQSPRAPAYLSVRDFAAKMAAMKGERPFDENVAAYNLQALRERFPEYSEALRPGQIKTKMNDAMRAGTEYEDVIANALQFKSGGIIARQAEITGNVAGTRFKGYADYLRLDKDKEGKDVAVFGDVKVTASNAARKRMYRAQVGLYALGGIAAAQSDEAWDEFVQRNKIKSDDAERMRKAILSGRVKGELTWAHPNEIAGIVGEGIAAEMGDDEIASVASAAIQTEQFDVGGIADEAVAAVADLANTPTATLANEASEAVQRIASKGGRVPEHLRATLKTIRATGGSYQSGVLARMGLTIQTRSTVGEPSGAFADAANAAAMLQGGQETTEERVRNIPPLYTPSTVAGLTRPTAQHAEGQQGLSETLERLNKTLEGIQTGATGEDAAPVGKQVPQRFAVQEQGQIAGRAMNYAAKYKAALEHYGHAVNELENFDAFSRYLTVERAGPPAVHTVAELSGHLARFAAQSPKEFADFVMSENGEHTRKMLEMVGKISADDLRTILASGKAGTGVEAIKSMGLDPERLMVEADAMIATSPTVTSAAGVHQAIPGVLAMARSLHEKEKAKPQSEQPSLDDTQKTQIASGTVSFLLKYNAALAHHSRALGEIEHFDHFMDYLKKRGFESAAGFSAVGISGHLLEYATTNPQKFADFVTSDSGTHTRKMLEMIGKISTSDLNAITSPEGKDVVSGVFKTIGIQEEEEDYIRKLAKSMQSGDFTKTSAAGVHQLAPGALTMARSLVDKQQKAPARKGGLEDYEFVTDEMRDKFERLQEASKKMAEHFEQVSDVSKKLYEELGDTGKVTHETRERMKSALEAQIKATAEAKAAEAEYKYAAAKAQYAGRPTPESATALMHTSALAASARQQAIKAQYSAGDAAERILKEGGPEPGIESPSEAASAMMRHVLGGFGMFYLGHLARLPMAAMSGGYANEERRLAEMQQISAAGGASAGLSTWEGRMSALRARQYSAYGPLSYAAASTIGQSGVAGASAAGAFAASALVGFAGPNVLRMTNAFGLTSVASDAVAGTVGTAMGWALPIGAALAAGAYTYGVVQNPQSKWVAANVALRQHEGTGVGLGNLIDTSLYNAFDASGSQGAVRDIYGMLQGKRMSRAEAASYAASAWVLSDEEVSKYTENAQQIARGLRYKAAAFGGAERLYEETVGHPLEIPRDYVPGNPVYGPIDLGMPLESTWGYAVMNAQNATPRQIQSTGIGEYEKTLLEIGQAEASGIDYHGITSALLGGRQFASGEDVRATGVLHKAFSPYLNAGMTDQVLLGQKRFGSLPFDYLRKVYGAKKASGITGVVAANAASAMVQFGGMDQRQWQMYQMAVGKYETQLSLGESVTPPAVSGFATGEFTQRDVMAAAVDMAHYDTRANIAQQLMTEGYSSSFSTGLAREIPTENISATSGFASGNLLSMSWLASNGYIDSRFVGTDIGPDGSPSGIMTPLTTSMRLGTMPPEKVASRIWGGRWHADKYTAGAVHGVTAGWNPSKTLYGMDAMRQQMSDLQYEAQMASIGNALARENLRWNFMTGGPGFSGGFSWHVEGLGGGSAGGGQWGYQDVMRQMQRAYQRFSYGIQGQRMDLSEQFYQTNYAMNTRQFEASQSYTRRQWALSDEANTLQWGWHVSDLRENMSFASGRERKLLERQLERDTTMHNIKEEGKEDQRTYQEQVWRLQKKRYQEERKHHEEMMALQKKQFEVSKKLFEEKAKVEDKYLQMQRKFAEENHKLALAAIGAQAYYAKEMHKLKEDTQGLSTAQRDITSQWALAISATSNAAIALLEALKNLGYYDGPIPKVINPKKVSSNSSSSELPHGLRSEYSRDFGASDVGSDYDRPRHHVGGFMPAFSPRTLKDGEIVVMASNSAYVMSEHEASDVFANKVLDNTSQDAAVPTKTTVEVIISSDDFRQFVREVIVDEMSSKIGG